MDRFQQPQLPFIINIFMFEALVERLLNQILGEYVEDFTADNLHIGIWSGEVTLKNIRLKKEIMKKLNLPFILRFSRLGCLKMNIPWKSLTSSKIEVQLEGLEIVIAQLPHTKWDCKNTKIIETRKKEIQDYCQSVLADFVKKGEKAKEDQQGYFSKLVVKIIDNLQVTIKDIHIRYQDQITQTYSFGVTLQELRVYTVNSEDQPQYIDRTKSKYQNQPLRKRLELYNLGVYWNEKSQFYTQTNYFQKLNGSIARRGEKKQQQHYIVLLSSQAKLLQREAGKQFFEPQIDLAINLQTLKIQITNNQLQQIINLGQRLQRYNNQVKMKNTQELSIQEKKKYLEDFSKIFPDFYKSRGKDLPINQVNRLEEILQKMETHHFTKIISKHLQEKEKERIIAQKKQKSKGWFSWGKPKELTNNQMSQIESYLNNNFAKEVNIVKRPEDYYHIHLKFRLDHLELTIANTLAIIKEGIISQFSHLSIDCQLRQAGYKLNLGLNDISVKLFKQMGVEPIELTSILYKVIPLQESSKAEKEYVRMQVVGNPLDKKYLNTDIKLVTSELMFVFYPKIVSVATQFADLKLSKENKEAAVEKYGELKQKTTSAVNQSLQQSKKQSIGADIFIDAITIGIPFDPKRPNGCCWGLTLGNSHFTTDQQTLKRTEIKEDLPIDVYKMNLKLFSFRQYENITILQNYRQRVVKQLDPKYAVIDKLDFLLNLQIFNKPTHLVPKIKISAIIPDLSLNLNQQLYKNLLKLGECFEEQKRSEYHRSSGRYVQKSQIKQKASKIGMVYIKDGVTQLWKKYVAIMSQNYIYIYLNTKDEHYSAYYYIKNATLYRTYEPKDKEKPYYFKIKNNLNEVTFGFDKPETIDDWQKKINNLSSKQQFQQSTNVGIGEEKNKNAEKKDPNTLSLVVFSAIQKVKIRVNPNESLEHEVIEFYLSRLEALVNLYEAKKSISLTLSSIQLQDSIYRYKKVQLKYFLKTQKDELTQTLIKIDINQLSKDHPQFDHVDSEIDIVFGNLICNYKCQTVKALMNFFVPPKQEQIPHAQIKRESEKSLTQAIVIRPQEQQESFSLKLNLKIHSIAVLLINQKIKTQLGKLGMSQLNLYTGISQKRLCLKGSLKQLYLIDYSRYPYTILQEQKQYESFARYLMKANVGQQKNMLQLDIQMLNTANSDHKKMLIDVQLNNLTVYYTQQPILRLITYLNTQMLPSFETGPKQVKQKQQSDERPQPSQMDLKVNLSNVSIFIEPNPLQITKKQYLQLGIDKITVRNNVFFRDYITTGEKLILVENYTVQLLGMCIYTLYYDQQNQKHQYQLTNKLSFLCSTDLIANPLYYQKTYHDKFLNGLRVECRMTPFFMGLSQKDYNFIMKCLNWSITHEDGTENILYDIPQNNIVEEVGKVQQKAPFYLKLSIECLSLFVINKNVPVLFLLLDQLHLDFCQKQDYMNIDLCLDNIYGTAMQFKEQNMGFWQRKVLHERGMFNSLGYQKSHEIIQDAKIGDLIKLFDRRDKLVKKQNNKPFMKFLMETRNQQNLISIQIEELIIDIDINILLVLSAIANTDQAYIMGPEPVRQKEVDIMQHIFPKLAQDIQQRNNLMMQKKKSSFNILINKIVSSISDTYKQKFIVFEGKVSFSMINEGQRTKDQLSFFFDNSQDARLNHSQMPFGLKNMTLYFCKIKDGEIRNKRQILKPVNITGQIKKWYSKKFQFFVLTSQVQFKISKLIFFSSFVDLINIDNIIQDNLKALKSGEEKKPQQQVVEHKLQEVTKEAQQVIQHRTRLAGVFEPIQFQLVNDCNNNFMPVLRFIIQDLKPFMDQYLIKTHISVVPMISLHFFNPRSSKWQPIIQPFQLNIDYLILLTQEGQNVKFLVESKPLPPANQIPSQNEASRQQQKRVETDIQTHILRINVSTQMLSTLLAAKQMAMKYKKKLQKVNVAILDFIMKQKPEKQQQQLQVEISPFIFENITNQTIFLEREQKEFQIAPLFKGPIKLDNDREIKFRLKGETYMFGLDHFGTLRISFSSYFIQYDADKLNRVIRFIPSIMIQNKLLQAVYIRRQGNNVSDVPRKVEIGQKIPLDNIKSLTVSLNSNSYTQVIQVNDIYMINTLNAANKKFNIIWNRKIFLNKYEVFQLLPPFIINNCIPKPMSLQFISKAKTINTKTVPSQATHQVCASQNIGLIQLKLSYPGYNWTKRFQYHPQKNGIEQSIVLQDESNGVTHLNYVFQQTKEVNQFILTIYCKKIIINELQDKLIIYGNLAEDEKHKRIDNYKLLGGQQKNNQNINDKITMIGAEVGDKLRICGVNSMFDFATPMLIGGLGQSQSRIVVDRVIQGKTESVFTIIGVTMSLMKMSNNCDIFCKKIVLTAKSIVSNNTSRDLIIKEQFASKFSSYIPKGERQLATFGLPELKDKMHDGYTIHTQGFGKSKVFHLPEQGSMFVRLQSEQINKERGQRDPLYFLVRAKTAQLYKFYEITEVSENNLPYQLKTKSKNLQVKVVNNRKAVGLGQSYKFMREDPRKQRFQVEIQINHEFSKDTLRVIVFPDDLNFKQKESIKIQRDSLVGQVALQIYIEINDKTKTIVVDEVHNVEEKRQNEKQYILINLPQIIISISQNSQMVSRPYESLVVSFRRLIFILQETDRKTTYQFKLGFLQIDQAYPHTLSNPVIITPNKFEEFTRDDKPEWVFNSMMVINNTYKETTFIDQISVDFNDIVVKFSLDFLNLVTEVSKEFTNILNYKDESTYLIVQVQKWKNMQIPKEGNKTFIKTIKISPFYIDLSAQLNLKKLGLNNNQLINTIMSAVGVVVSNIEDAPIRLSGMAITNCIDTAEGITSKIVSRYKGDVINQLYKIFGSLNIIGNPMGLLRSISTGFEDFSKKPARGFVHGPAQFGKGIAQGTGSLVAHSVGGAFNSLSKVTGTLSTGLATFAFDKDFEQHREKQKMKKPQNVIQGLEKGGRAILYGFKAGISGVFTQPYQSARKEGALGFMKGAAKGLAGLIVKPVTGVIDFASKTTEGIKNNALVFEDKANGERMRYPRVFYTECFVMKEYNKIDSQIQSILMKPVNQDKFINVTFVDCFASDEAVNYLVILREYVVFLDVEKRKVHWALPILQFQCASLPQKKSIVFKGKRRFSLFQSNIFEVRIEDEQERNSIVGLINKIIKQKLENI